MSKEKQIVVFLLLTSLVVFQTQGKCRNRIPFSAMGAKSGKSVNITGTKIPIEAARWYQVNNTTNGLEGLFDSIIDQKVETGYGKILNKYEAYYPLDSGEEMTITSVRMYDGEGTFEDQPMTLSIITSTWQRKAFATFKGLSYGAWVGPNPDKQSTYTLTTPITGARYLLITTYGYFPDELELYGTYKAGTKTTTATPVNTAKFKDALGVNVYEWNFEDGNTPWMVDSLSLKSVKNFSAVRHYMDWEKLETTKGSYSYNPTIEGGWNYDAIYESCKTEGIEVLADLKTTPQWMQETYPEEERDYENVPLFYGKKYSDPASYIDQAKVAFQYVARYGNNPNVNRSLLKVNTTPRWDCDQPNTIKVGLGLVKYIECDNERDKTWKGRNAYQTGREYAANLSAFYDGHKKTLGAGVGVKNADSTMKVVIGGLAGSTTDFVRAMIDWCKEFRGYKADGKVNLCWDVINYHLYSGNGAFTSSGEATRGTAPEISGTGKQAVAMVKMAHDYLNDMPVWITEAGYDTNQESPLKAIAIGSKTVLQTQGDWITRSALMYARSGIKKVFFYQLTDDDATLPVQYYSMGLINDDKTRRPAADYIVQLRKYLGEYSYVRTISTSPIVDRYELDGKPAFALMVPDERGKAANYTLSVGSYTSAKIIKLKKGSSTGDVQTAKIVSGKISLTVTETPMLVVIQ